MDLVPVMALYPCVDAREVIVAPWSRLRPGIKGAIALIDSVLRDDGTECNQATANDDNKHSSKSSN